MSYSKKTIVGAFAYKFIEQFATKGITFLVGIVLARLIAPDQYGALAILQVFVSLSNTITQTGMNAALLQKKDIEESDYSVVLYLSIVLSIVIYTIIFLTAPAIEKFYDSNGLSAALRVYSVILFIGSFNSIQVTKLVKEMKVQILMRCNVIASILSGIVGIVLAYKGFGLWALVWQAVINILVSCIIVYILNPWRPKKFFSIEKAKEFWSFGWKITLSGLINTGYNEIRSLIVGKRFSTADLGYYNRGFQFPYFVVSNVNSTIQTIALPVLSSEQDNLDRVKGYVRKAIVYGSFFIIPIMFFLFISAKDIITVLIGDKWLPAVLYMKIFCVAYVFDSIRAINGEAIKALGKSGLYLKLEITRKIVLILLLIVSLAFFNSPIAIAYGFMIGSLIETAILAIPCKNLFNYGYKEQLFDLLPIFCASAITFVGLFFLGKIIESSIITLIIQLIVGIPAYIIITRIFKITVIKGLLVLLKNK